jgi:hypothetical protein
MIVAFGTTTPPCVCRLDLRNAIIPMCNVFGPFLGGTMVAMASLLLLEDNMLEDSNAIFMAHVDF